MNSSKYFRVPKKKEPLQENEVFITRRQDTINFLKYALFLFEKRNLPYVKFKASGSAIASLVNLAEILKKIIPEIHQINRVYTLKYEQDYEPKEKGLDHVTIVRNVPILEISFYKVLPDVDVNTLYGYQPALSKEIFERVKINVASLFRKHNAHVNMQGSNTGVTRRGGNKSYRYKAGFRGRYRAGFRGKERGKKPYTISTYTPGFRGGKKMRGFGQYHSKFDDANSNANVNVGEGNASL